MLKTLRQIASIGIVSERPPQTDESLRVRESLSEQIRTVLGRAPCIRHVDAGSCNGCELEIHALNNPLYNLEGLGIRFVASPRHADVLLVTGRVSNVVPVDVAIPGCPPSPTRILEGILAILEHSPTSAHGAVEGAPRLPP